MEGGVRVFCSCSYAFKVSTGYNIHSWLETTHCTAHFSVDQSSYSASRFLDLESMWSQVSQSAVTQQRTSGLNLWHDLTFLLYCPSFDVHVCGCWFIHNSDVPHHHHHFWTSRSFSGSQNPSLNFFSGSLSGSLELCFSLLLVYLSHVLSVSHFRSFSQSHSGSLSRSFSGSPWSVGLFLDLDSVFSNPSAHLPTHTG